VVKCAQRNGILLVHGMDSWYTKPYSAGKLHNILEAEGIHSVPITWLLSAKEPSCRIRVGLVAGSSAVIDIIQIHNSAFAAMILEVNTRRRPLYNSLKGYMRRRSTLKSLCSSRRQPGNGRVWVA
jgi:hypothetical protein